MWKCVTHREKLESQDLLDLVVSVGLLDPWDLLAWPELLESLDVRYQEKCCTVSISCHNVFNLLVNLIWFVVGNPW